MARAHGTIKPMILYLRAFWKKGIENMGTHESVVSIGMRGDGDMPMTQGSNMHCWKRS
jgi:hypothetical protein